MVYFDCTNRRKKINIDQESLPKLTHFILINIKKIINNNNNNKAYDQLLLLSN